MTKIARRSAARANVKEVAVSEKEAQAILAASLKQPEPKSRASVGVREVKILDASLHETTDGDIVAHGVVANECLGMLRVAPYQREVISTQGRKTSLVKAVEDGALLPAVALSMRGQKFSERGNTMTLHDPVYIVDGLQRISAIKMVLEAKPELDIEPIEATIYFGKDEEWEKERFKVLNTRAIKVSPSVLLRNERENHPSVLTLYGLSTNDPSFALYQKVSWDQRPKRGELITGLTLAKIARTLHGTSGSPRAIDVSSGIRGGGYGRENTRGPMRALTSLDAVAQAVKLMNFRENIKEFFELIDKAWGLRKIEYGAMAVQMRGNILLTTAAVLAAHEDFWVDGERRLVVENSVLSKFRTFPLGDPEIMRLASAGHMAIRILFDLMVEHLNKGKRKNRLRQRMSPDKAIAGGRTSVGRGS